ncbi:MAG: hypothetical protein LC734_05580 [Acidobacteria bacterium]|nr:hypothetical protein [Acidobacteriota bacterium]
MQSSFTSVPFSTESGHGLSTYNGVAKFSSAGVVLEFESKLFGVIARGVKEVRLPIAEILDIKFRKGVLKRGAKIEIRTKSFAKLVELPNSDGKVSLKLARDDFERGRKAVEELQREMLVRTELESPVHSPVSELFLESNVNDGRLPGDE